MKVGDMTRANKFAQEFADMLQECLSLDESQWLFVRNNLAISLIREIEGREPTQEEIKLLTRGPTFRGGEHEG